MVSVDEKQPLEQSYLRDTTPAEQDYLKAIYKLQPEESPVPTMAIAERLNLSSAAISKMLKHLAAQGLVEHSRYYGAKLTEAGEKIALEVIRHHRLVELYLVKALGVPWDRVDIEAEVLEHVLSEELEERIAAVLDDPTHDPHGDPIPRLDGSLEDQPHRRLADVSPGTHALVLRVPDRDPRLLRYFGEIGLVPKAAVHVVRREPFDGPMHLRLDGSLTEHVVGRDIAERISVSL